jgi:hypothetical protein
VQIAHLAGLGLANLAMAVTALAAPIDIEPPVGVQAAIDHLNPQQTGSAR